MKIMSFLWRRRLSVVKIVILLSAVWFTVEFLIYSDDLRTSNIVAAGPHALELKYNNDFDDGGDDANNLGAINNDIFNEKNDTVVNNVILSNLNNIDTFNSIRNAKDDSGKHQRISVQHRYDAKKPPAFDDNGKFTSAAISIFVCLNLKPFSVLRFYQTPLTFFNQIIKSFTKL